MPRLLSTLTGRFRSVTNPEEVRYAILSHAWAARGEQTYDDLLEIQAEVHAARASGVYLPPNEVLLRASPKIRNACAYALSEGFEYLWIDACCIDKSSSAELSEAINSMYQWYSQATVCYAFLDDVPGDEPPSIAGSRFRASRWFTRGWTLQELIAPRVVIFLSAEWDMLGGKDGLSALVEEITGIDPEILVHARPLSSVSVARRMAWAARRVTTRKEDEAYSLMGIFGVNMPTIYGEGRFAFIRLQEEILRHIPDQSLFAWQRIQRIEDSNFVEKAAAEPTLLATSPADFELSGEFDCVPLEEAWRFLGIAPRPPPTYTISAYGIRTALPLTVLSSRVAIAYLACSERGTLLGLILQKNLDAYAWSVGAVYSISRACANIPAFTDTAGWHRLVRPPTFSSPNQLASQVSIQEIYVMHRPKPISSSSSRLWGISCPRPRASPVQLYWNSYMIKLPKWCQNRLALQGYSVSLISSSHVQPTSLHHTPRTYTLRLIQGTAIIEIYFGP